MVPFFLCACPFGSALARGAYWLGETCAALMKNFLSPQTATLDRLAAHFAAHIQCEISLA